MRRAVVGRKHIGIQSFRLSCEEAVCCMNVGPLLELCFVALFLTFCYLIVLANTLQLFS